MWDSENQKLSLETIVGRKRRPDTCEFNWSELETGIQVYVNYMEKKCK